ncbi:MAG: hypothetical protein KC620_05230 [Myxococcales bacterium]|nr:hypothetical protein [Myxococcales bacterium]
MSLALALLLAAPGGLPDHTMHPAVRAARAGLVARLAAAEAAPRARRLDVEPQGEVIVVRATGGEFDGDWADPAVLERALFTLVDGVRQAQPGLDPHFIVILTTFPVAEPAAFYLPMANDVRGIGYRHLEASETFRFITGRLDGLIFANAVTAHAGDRAALGRALFLQEIGHRWGVYVRLPDAALDLQTRLLGRDCAHWSHFATLGGSAMEGEDWRAVAPERWRAEVPTVIGYQAADRYLMGLLPIEAVPPVQLVSPEGWWCGDPDRGGVPNPRWAPPTWRTGEPASATGVAEMVDFAAVAESEGPRVPGFEASRRVFSAVFAVAARAADEVEPARAAADALRLDWTAAFATAAAADTADGLRLASTLVAARLVVPPGSVPPGGSCLDRTDCATEDAVCVPDEREVGRCAPGCLTSADCPAEACCVGSPRHCAASDAGCAPDGAPPDGSLPEPAPDLGSLDAGAGPLDATVHDADPAPGSTGSDGCAMAAPRPRAPAWWLAVGLALLSRRRRARRCGRGWR